MPLYTPSPWLGTVVTRATAALPQTTTASLFTVATGRVLLTSLVGAVTTVIQTQANNTKIVFDPTAAGATGDLCANLDITGDAVGTFYSITGTPATAMQDNLLYVPPNKALAWPGIVLDPGAIALTCAASNTGSVSWTVTYVPLDTGATVAAA